MDWHGPGSNSWARSHPQTAKKWQTNPGTSTCSLAGQLLATCKKIYEESSTVLYGENTFGLYVHIPDHGDGRAIEASFFEGQHIAKLELPWPGKTLLPRGKDSKFTFDPSTFAYSFAVDKIRKLRLVIDLDFEESWHPKNRTNLKEILGLDRKVTDVIQQNNKIKQSLAESLRRDEDLQKRIKELEIRLHQQEEQRASGISVALYSGAALRGVKATAASDPPNQFPPIKPFADPLFCTVDFSRAEGGEKATDIPVLRERIEKEIQKGENKTFQCKAIVKVHQTQPRVRILCRDEKELNTVREAAIAVTTEGARVLRDQLYPVKVN